MYRFILLLCLICVYRSDAASPSVTSATMEIQNVEAGDGHYEVVDVKVTFDQDIFLKLHNGTKLSAQNLLGQKSIGHSRIAKSIYYGRGSVQMECQGTMVQANDLFDMGPSPDALYVGTPSPEPVSSFILSFSNIIINETFANNQVSILRISDPNGIWDQEQLKQCKLYFKQSTSNDQEAIFTNSDDEPVSSAAIEFSRIEPRQCDFQKFENFREVWENVLGNALSSTKTQDALNTMEMTFMAVLSRSGFTNCFNLLKSFLTLGSSNMTLPGYRDCPHEWNETDPAWLADPCCNWRLSETTCCEAKPVTIQVPALEGTNPSIISASCRNVAKVDPIITDYIDSYRKQQLLGKEDPRDYWDKFYRFFSDCQTKVFNQDCTSDSQCPFTGECDKVRQKCFVSYNSVSEAMAKCFVAEMDPDLRNEFKAHFNMKAIYSTVDEENMAFYELLLNKTTSEDCVGPTSDHFKSRRNWVENDEGMWEEVVTPGNASGCLSESYCNVYSYWQTYGLEDNSCPSDAPSNICMDCRGDFCEPVSSQPECYEYINSANCALKNGTYENYRCYFPEDTKETCLTNQWCRNAEHWDHECSRPQCIVSNITNETACDDWRTTQQNNGVYYGFWWNHETSACQTWMDHSQCEFAGYYYWPGRHFTPGKYHTEALCNEGLCTNPKMRWQKEQATSAECKASQYCTTPCKGCISGGGSHEQACVNLTVTDMTSCIEMGYKWEAPSFGFPGICYREDFMYDKVSCEAAGLMHYSCENSTEKSTCGSSVAQPILRCFWSNHKKCSGRAECEASGYCTDWDLANNCEFNDCSDTGVCLKLHNITRMCDYDARWSESGCVIQTNETNCDSLGYEWVERARNRSECLDSVKMCKDPERGGWFSLKNATECTKCDGTMDPVYRWIEPQWNNGTIRNLTWVPVTQKTVNQWTQTFDYGKFGQILDTIVSGIVARKQYNAFSKKYNPLVLLLDRLACDCGANGNSDCFGTVESVVLEQCRIDPGSTDQTCGGLTIDTSSQANSTNATSTSIQVDEVPASQLAGGSDSSTRGLKQKSIRLRTDVSAYAVVQMGGETVGQLVGNGKGFSCSDGNCDGASFIVCFDKNPSIPQDTSTYTVLDIAPASGNGVGEPMSITVTEKNGGLQYCASLTESGTYYPILRKSVLPASTGGSSTSSDGSGGGATATSSGISGTNTATATATATATSTIDGSEPGSAAPGRAMGEPASWMVYVSVIVASWLVLFA